jgi:hypothetical protein
LSLCGDSGPGRRFPFLPKADGNGAPSRRPDKGSRERFRFISGASRVDVKCNRLVTSAEPAPQINREHPDSLAISPQIHPRAWTNGAQHKRHSGPSVALYPDAKMDPRFCSGRQSDSPHRSLWDFLRSPSPIVKQPFVSPRRVGAR